MVFGGPSISSVMITSHRYKAGLKALQRSSVYLANFALALIFRCTHFEHQDFYSYFLQNLFLKDQNTLDCVPVVLNVMLKKNNVRLLKLSPRLFFASGSAEQPR